MQPKTFKQNADHSHARSPSKHQTNTFQGIRNKQDPAIRYTMQYEDGNKSLNFLDFNITNTNNNKYEFKVYSKKAITNIQIKPISCIGTSTIKVYSKVFFTEYTRYVPRNTLKKKENFLLICLLKMVITNNFEKT